MSKGKIVLIVAGALVTVGAVAAMSAPGERGHRGDGYMMGDDHAGGFRGRMHRWFHKSMTREQFDANTRARFARLDKNGDGFIDQAEIEAALKQRMEERRGKGRDSLARMLRRTFNVDINHDGKVTRDEYLTAVRKRFAQLDLNNDGKITDDDLPPLMRGRGVLANDAGGRGRGMRMLGILRGAAPDKDGAITLDAVVAAAGTRFDRIDTAHTGTIDKTTADKLRQAMLDYRVKRFVHAFGADKDGKVSKDQFFTRAGERFARLDRDGDGTLTRGERRGMGREGHHGGKHWWRHDRREAGGQGETPAAPERGDGPQSK